MAISPALAPPRFRHLDQHPRTFAGWRWPSCDVYVKTCVWSDHILAVQPDADAVQPVVSPSQPSK